jgi:hypothetical protein
VRVIIALELCFAEDATILDGWSATRKQSDAALTRLVMRSLGAVCEVPMSGKVSAEVLCAGASDTALRLAASNRHSLQARLSLLSFGFPRQKQAAIDCEAVEGCG